MARIAVAAVAGGLGPSIARAPAAPERSRASIRAAADTLLESLHARGQFNGAVVLGLGTEEIYARGFGPANVAAGVAFTPDTPADGGSIAKTFTAAAVLMLENDGRLHLDDTVRQHVHEFPHPGTRIRDLITHSSGVPEDYEFFDRFVPPDRVKTTAGLIDVLRDQAVPPDFPPGTRFRYSSFGFDVAALIVERVSGMRWDGFLRRRIFGPLGMRATFLRPPRLADWPGVRTLSYRPSPGGLALWDVFDNEGFYGGSNLYFSARDLHRWSRSFYTHPVLSPSVLARGRTAAVLSDPDTGDGGRSALNLLSWYYAPGSARYHYPGSLQGFWGSVYRDETRRASIVYISNNAMPQWLRPLLTRALIDVLDGRPAAIAPRAYREIRAADFGAIAGTYDVDRVGVVTFSTRAGRMFVRIGHGIEYPAFPVGDGQLYMPGLDVWVGFPSDGFARLSWLSIFEVTEGRRAD